MERSWIYRVIAYSLITVFFVVVLIPSVADWTGQADKLPPWFKSTFTRKISLGLDLQGGLRLVYEVQVDKAITDKADRLAAQVEERLHEKKAKNFTVSRLGSGPDSQIKITFENHGDIKKIDGAFQRDFARYLTEDSRDANTGNVVFKLDADLMDELRGYAIS